MFSSPTYYEVAQYYRRWSATALNHLLCDNGQVRFIPELRRYSLRDMTTEYFTRRIIHSSDPYDPAIQVVPPSSTCLPTIGNNAPGSKAQRVLNEGTSYQW